MFQIPTQIWNRIAIEAKVKSQKMENLMKMNQEDLTVALENQAKHLEKHGYSSMVITAYQVIAPLLIENEAIQNWIADKELLDLRQALPDVANVDEAVALMVKEYRLDRGKAESLTELLNRTLAP